MKRARTRAAARGGFGREIGGGGAAGKGRGSLVLETFLGKETRDLLGGRYYVSKR